MTAEQTAAKARKQMWNLMSGARGTIRLFPDERQAAVIRAAMTDITEEPWTGDESGIRYLDVRGRLDQLDVELVVMLDEQPALDRLTSH